LKLPMDFLHLEVAPLIKTTVSLKVGGRVARWFATACE
jgi:hypothetical protein